MSHRKDDAGMANSSLLGAYWGARPELLDRCADRLLAFVSALAEVDPLLATWCEPGESRAEALTSTVDLTYNTLRDLLFDGRYRRNDEKRTIVQDLGYSADLWNGQDVEVGLSVSCGGWTSRMANSARMRFPESVDSIKSHLHERDTILALTRIMVDAWSPVHASWVNRDLRKAQGAQRGDVVVGWATYLSEGRLAKAGPLPTDVRSEPLGDGLLITIGDDPMSTPLPLVMAVREALGPAVSPES
jgi:hypothetical protein